MDADGAHNLYDGRIRLMKPDGTFTDFDPQDYADYLGEHVEPNSYGKFPYARCWNEGFSLDLDHPKGIYRANTLARINVADRMATPRAQAELEEFRDLFGRPAQATLLYHWARLIEEVYACEHAIELLEDPAITDPNVRATGRAERRPRRRVRGSPARDADPRLLDGRKRAHHARQPDRRDHPQPGPHEHEREAGRPHADQGRSR